MVIPFYGFLLYSKACFITISNHSVEQQKLYTLQTLSDLGPGCGASDKKSPVCSSEERSQALIKGRRQVHQITCWTQNGIRFVFKRKT